MTNRQKWLKNLVSLGKWAEGQLDVSLRIVTPIDDVWAAYKESRKRPASGESTLKHYQVIWNQFARWLAEQPVSGRISALDDLPEKFCEKYTAYLEQNRKVSTVTKHLVVLKLIFRIVCPDIQNPWRDIRVMKVEAPEEKRKKRALEPKEVTRLIVSCRSLYEDSPILSAQWVGLHLVGYWTGLRLYDAVHLSGEHIDVNMRVIRITPKKTGRKKPEPLEIPLSSELVSFFDEWAPESDFVFSALARMYDEQGSWRIVSYLSAIWDEAGVKGNAKGSATFHSLRVTFQSLNDNAGTSWVFTRAVTGHSDAKMSDTYSRSNIEVIRKAVTKALPKVNN